MSVFSEKLAVLAYMMFIPFSLVLGAACLYASPWLAAAYLSYLFYINTPAGLQASRTAGWAPVFRRLPFWRHFANYFPARIHKTRDLPPEKGPYLFNVCPHGVAVYSAWAAFDTDGCGFSKLYPGLDCRPLTLLNNFRVPFMREFLLGHGVCDVSKATCLSVLSRGKHSAIMLAAGGASESLLAKPKKYDLVLAKRKGFVRVALQTGASLVPVIFFGENDLYEVYSPPKGSMLHMLQMAMLKYLGFTVPIIWGVGIFLGHGFMPKRVPLNIVIGGPLEVQKFEGSSSSKEFATQVDRVHEQYMLSLKRLWDDHKDTFAADRRRSLQF